MKIYKFLNFFFINTNPTISKPAPKNGAITPKPGLKSQQKVCP